MSRRTSIGATAIKINWSNSLRVFNQFYPDGNIRKVYFVYENAYGSNRFLNGRHSYCVRMNRKGPDNASFIRTLQTQRGTL